ncbi:MAG: T9SS type A sorting domain-containing protein, partial [Cryomorphaceae bacterium]|nr:T9SS type A sorting domain-containing protein [Cryomorphaceae bacterium]
IHTNDHSNKINDSLSIIGDTICIYYCISSSPGMTAPTFIDTFELGMFTAGDYFVVVNAYKAIDTVDCSNPIDSARGTETFTITETVSVHRETLEDDFSLEIAPNPTDDFQTLTLKTETSGKIHIEIYDLSGRMVRQVFSGEMAAGEQTFLADLRDLKSGTYLYRVAMGNEIYHLKAVKL